MTTWFAGDADDMGAEARYALARITKVQKENND